MYTNLTTDSSVYLAVKHSILNFSVVWNSNFDIYVVSYCFEKCIFCLWKGEAEMCKNFKLQILNAFLRGYKGYILGVTRLSWKQECWCRWHKLVCCCSNPETDNMLLTCRSANDHRKLLSMCLKTVFDPRVLNLYPVSGWCVELRNKVVCGGVPAVLES